MIIIRFLTLFIKITEPIKKLDVMLSHMEVLVNITLNFSNRPHNLIYYNIGHSYKQLSTYAQSKIFVLPVTVKWGACIIISNTSISCTNTFKKKIKPKIRPHPYPPRSQFSIVMNSSFVVGSRGGA